MTKKQNKVDAFDAYEALPSSYHNDPRWAEVRRLRAEHDKNPESDACLRANGLVGEIRSSYGFDH